MTARTRVTRSDRLGLEERDAALARLRAKELDVLVVGGGIVGVGSALDAVTRGLSTGLIEARDFGSGTSSRSSKLVHGGIRYLEQGEFRLVTEALTERGLLLQRLAPHLVRPVRFFYPITKGVIERCYIGAGMVLYDVLSRLRRHPGVPHHRHHSRAQIRRAAPSLRSDVVRGAISYYDAQVDDARYVVNLARTASFYGAHVASRVRAEGFITVGERVVGVHARDVLTDETFEIRARQVINATGVWTDDTQRLLGERGTFRVRASKGVHLVVPRDRFHSTSGLLLRTEKSVLFVIPWGRHWIIGTTDTDWNLDKAHPAATAADIEYLLQRVNSVLRTPLTPEDVEGVYAGLRPLLAGEDEQTSQLSREHLVAHTVPGLVMVAGGKWTTYRVMAADAVNAAVSGIDGAWPASITADVPLLGAVGFKAAWNKRHKIARAFGVHPVRIEHLMRRYGTLTDQVLELITTDSRLGQTLPGCDDYLLAEVVYAARFEGALHVDDVLARRLRVSIEAWDRGWEAAETVAQLMAAELGWDASQQAEEVQRYRDRVSAERESQTMPDDVSADRARLLAKDFDTR